MEHLELEYLDQRSNLLYEMDDDEFVSWLDCDDCTLDDYEALKTTLIDLEMYERVIMVNEYIESW